MKMGKLPTMQLSPATCAQTGRRSLTRALLRPVVRFCLRNAIQYQEVADSLKSVFVEQARIELERSCGIPNVSRLSAATGLQRKDIQRILETPSSEASSLLSRVVGQWHLDKEFLDKRGKPRRLRYGGTECEFSRVVWKVSSDLNPGTIVLELERLGAIARTDRHLILKSEVLQLSGNLGAALESAAAESEHLFETVESNVALEHELPNLHATTEFTNIRLGSLPLVRKWLLDQGSELHARARRFLSELDNDLHARDEQSGATVSLTTFSHIALPDLIDSELEPQKQ